MKKRMLLKSVLLVALATGVGLAFSACEVPPSGQNAGRSATTLHDYKIVTVEQCEYIEVDAGFGSGQVYTLTHKGNCKNPIHEHNKQKSESTVTIVK